MLQNKKASVAEMEQRSPVFLLLIGATVLFMLWAPLWAALFNGQMFDFERPIYQALRWASVILAILVVYLFNSWTPRDWRDLLSMSVLLFPLIYLISFFSAATYHLAANMIYIQLIYAALFIFGMYGIRQKLGNTIIHQTIYIMSYFIVFFGLFHWFGNGKFIADVLGWLIPLKSAAGTYLDAVMTDSNGLRLTSFFQYANTYAAFLIALLFMGSYLVVRSRKWYAVGIHAFMLVPIILSFFLTLSRAAYVILPIVFIILILFLKPYRQILFTVHLGLSFIASLIILNRLTALGIEVNTEFSGASSRSGWLLVLGVSVVYAVIAVLIQRFTAPWLERKLATFSTRKASAFIMPGVAVVLGAVLVFVFIGTSAKNLLPENVKIRLENINFAQHSVLERETFYKDALKLVADYPIFGAGGGAWYALYEKYQHNPYTSRQAHSFYFQNLVETGLLGLLILLAFLAAVLYFYIRHYARSTEDERDSRFIYFIIAISLLIHSVLDFDLSYVFIGLLLFLCLGGLMSSASTPTIGGLEKIKAIKWGYPSVLGALAILMFVFAQFSLNANADFKQTNDVIKVSQNYNEIIEPLDSALKISPTHPDYIHFKVSLLQQVYKQTNQEQFFEEAQQLLDKTLAKEPYNRFLLEKQIIQFEFKNQPDKILALTEQQLINHPWDSINTDPDPNKRFPWTVSLYDRNITLNAEFGNKARIEGDTEKMNVYWDHALATYQKVLDQNQVIASLPKEQSAGRQFIIVPQTSLALGQIYFKRDEYAKASEVLKPAITPDYNDAVNRDIIRQYLAALQKQGTTDQALYDTIVGTNPNEKQIIESIVNEN